MSSQEASNSINIISINCWGLKFISKHRRERLTEIGRQIASAQPKPDIVGLQECWTQEDYNAIRSLTSSILPHGKFYYSGVFGSGLAILSRWPIEGSSMFPYTLNGRPTAFFRGDWYVGKGVASARIRADRLGILEVFCTHLHAPYEREPNDSYICHRTAQAWEISKLMKAAVDRGHLAIGLGDFNMVPLSLAHCLIEAHASVRDVWRLMHPDSSIGAAHDEAEKARMRPMPSAHFNITVNGATCDSPLNTWRWNKGHQRRLEKGEDIHVPQDVDDPTGKRLDYVFVGSRSPHWVVDRVNVGLTGRHETLLCSLSDHFSIEATISNSELEASQRHGPTVRPSRPFATLETYEEIMAMVASYEAREIRQRKLRIAHFFLSVIVSIACLIAVWWSPHNGVAFALMLVSTLNLTAGSVNGLIGFLFMGWELRTMQEFRWEIHNAKKLAIQSMPRPGDTLVT